MALVQAGVHLWPVEILCHAPCGAGYYGGPLVRPVCMLLHVFGKVGFLGVALAAVGTDVRLYMLRLLVLGDVLEQRLLVREALVAGVALVRLVSLVAPGVGLQVGQLGEGLGAAWMTAFVRFVPGVGSDVLL